MNQRLVLTLSLASLAAVGLVACIKKQAATPASSAPAASMPMSNMPMSGMPMSNMMSGARGMMASAAKTGDSTGVVKAVDAAAGTITLDHQPIPGVGWPAMTMTFNADPALLKNIRVGERVKFAARIQGDDNRVIKIDKQ